MLMPISNLNSGDNLDAFDYLVTTLACKAKKIVYCEDDAFSKYFNFEIFEIFSKSEKKKFVFLDVMSYKHL